MSEKLERLHLIADQLRALQVQKNDIVRELKEQTKDLDVSAETEENEELLDVLEDIASWADLELSTRSKVQFWKPSSC
jgi:hypothetical protein